eukprot:COSAG06_NODE_5910_length_3216_cov_2.400064_1_plen_831_part_10
MRGKMARLGATPALILLQLAAGQAAVGLLPEASCSRMADGARPCEGLALKRDTLSGRHATLARDDSKEYCTLDGPGSCPCVKQPLSCPCVMQKDSRCDVECDRGYYLAGNPNAHLLKCGVVRDELEFDFTCMQCPEGKDTEGTGSTRPEQCNVCAPGYSGHPPASLCTKCPVGRWKGEPGDGDCMACRSGTTTAGRGAQHAADCSPPPPCWGLALASDTLSGRHATLARDASKEYCTLDGPGSCSAPPCTMRQGENCEVECDRGYYLENPAANLLKCGVVRDQLEFDFTCTACAAGQYKDTVGNEGCRECEGAPEGAQICRPPGSDWCNGTLRAGPGWNVSAGAHSCDDACSVQAGSVATRLAGDPIKAGDNCTIAVGVDPFRVGWTRKDRDTQSYTFRCGSDGEWSQVSPLHPPLLYQQIRCSPWVLPTGEESNCSINHHVSVWGEVCKLECANGYGPKQEDKYAHDMPYVICRDPKDNRFNPNHNPVSGSWELLEPSTPHHVPLYCIPTTCDPMPLHAHATPVTDGPGIDPRCNTWPRADDKYEAGVYCNSTCVQGYYPSSGDTTRTCSGGQWSGTPLVCTRDGYCASPLPEYPSANKSWQKHSQLEPGCDPRCGSTCTIECDNHYVRPNGGGGQNPKISARCACGESVDTDWSVLPGQAPLGDCLGCRDRRMNPTRCDCDLPPTENAKSCRGISGHSCTDFQCEEGYKELLSNGEADEYICTYSSISWMDGNDTIAVEDYKWTSGNQLCQRDHGPPASTPTDWETYAALLVAGLLLCAVLICIGLRRRDLSKWTRRSAVQRRDLNQEDASLGRPLISDGQDSQTPIGA